MSEKQTKRFRWVRMLTVVILLFNIPLIILLTLAYGLMPAAREWLIWLVLFHANFTGIFIAGAVIGSDAVRYLAKQEADYYKSMRAFAAMREAHETVKRDLNRLRQMNGLEPLDFDGGNNATG